MSSTFVNNLVTEGNTHLEELDQRIQQHLEHMDTVRNELAGILEDANSLREEYERTAQFVAALQGSESPAPKGQEKGTTNRRKPPIGKLDPLILKVLENMDEPQTVEQLRTMLPIVAAHTTLFRAVKRLHGRGELDRSTTRPFKYSLHKEDSVA